jgi:hypothetical protein
MRHSELKLFASHAVSERIAFRFLNLQGSDNSAAINWVIENTKGANKVFFRNCRNGMNPFIRFPQAQLFGEIEGVYPKKDYIELLNAQPDYLAQIDAFFLSYESVDLTVLNKVSGRRLSAGYEDRVERNVYIQRNFINWFASCWQQTVNRFGTKNLQEPQPISFIAEMLRLSKMWKANLINSHDSKFIEDHNLTILRYEDWCSNTSYRQNLSAELGFTGGKLEVDIVDDTGSASSWRNMLLLPQFRTMIGICLEDDELRTLVRDEYPDGFDTVMNTIDNSAKGGLVDNG